MRVLVYQNPDAGHESMPPKALVDELQRSGHDVVWMNAKKHQLTEAGIEAVDLVVAAGGDGNVGRAARQLVGRRLPIAVFPLGTANNLASTLGAGEGDLAGLIADWRLVPFDAGTLAWPGGREWFFEGFGIGAFAETAASLTALDATHPSPPNREAELARDIDALIARARAQDPIECEVEAGSRSVRGRLIMLELLNIGLIGPGVRLAPDGDPSDGALDVVIIPEDQRAALTTFLEAIRRGESPSKPPGEVVRAGSVRVRVGTGAVAHIDGLSVDLPASEIEVGIRPHALWFLAGPTTRP